MTKRTLEKILIVLFLSAFAAFFVGGCGDPADTSDPNLDQGSDFANTNDGDDLLDGRGDDADDDDATDDDTDDDTDDGIIIDDSDDPVDFDPDDSEVDCGDGLVSTPETCDDGNDLSGDGCSNICRIEECGDGVVNDTNETCDDGNTADADGCSSACQGEITVVASARTKLDVGYAHVCYSGNALQSIKCWGENSAGQLGQGNTSDIGEGTGTTLANTNPVSVGTGISSEIVVAGGNATTSTTCIITSLGGVKCWGANNSGQLGQGNTANLGDNVNEMGDNLTLVSLGTNRTAEDLDVGGDHVCVLLDNDTVKCWGEGGSGQLGQGATDDLGDGAGEMGDNLSAIDLGAGRTGAKIATGNGFSCAVLDDASLKCWGLNDVGQLGQGSTDSLGDGAGEMGDNLTAISLGVGRTATAVATGEAHTCALLDDATVKCWGEGGSGQLGQGATDDLGDGAGEMGDNLAAISLGAGRTATAIATGDNHTCALLDNATVKCWGENGLGQLGQESTDDLGDGAGEMGDNLSAIDLGTGRTATAIAAGGDTTCALLDNSTVKCWGANASGQLAQESITPIGDGANEMGDDLAAIATGF